MENKQVIYTRQFIWLLFILFTSLGVIKLPTYLISISSIDCWLSILLGWTLDVLFGTIYAYMGIRFRGQSYIEHSITIWGKYLGRLPGIILLIFFLTFASGSLNSLSLIVSKMLLPKTPTIVILATSTIVAAYCSKKGLKVLARFSELMGPLFFISIIILVICIIPFLKADNLTPQLTAGTFSILTGGYFMLSYLAICIMMTMFIPYNDIMENGFIAKFVASSLGSVIVLIFSVSSVGVFGIQQSKKMWYPGFELAKIIHFDNFFERIESIWLIIAITASILTFSILFWVSSLGLAQITKIQDHTSLIYPIALLSFVLSATSFNNDIKFGNFSLYVYPIFPIVITTFEFLLLITAIIKKEHAT